MCDISKTTSLKTKTVYKLLECKSFRDSPEIFISPFALCELMTGLVDKKHRWYNSNKNSNMIGRVSGFEKLMDAVHLYYDMSDAMIATHLLKDSFGNTMYPSKCMDYGSNSVIARVVLEPTEDMPIMEGTIAGISHALERNMESPGLTFAGPFVKSIEVLLVKDIQQAFYKHRNHLLDTHFKCLK